MKHPQTLAEKLYQQFPTIKLKAIKDCACCAFTFMWRLGIETDDADAIITVGRMIDKGVLDPDCTVNWSKVSEYLTGRKCAVEFVDIKDIKKIKDRTPVKFERTFKDENGNKKTTQHWVGIEGGRIRFNSIQDSITIREGKPTTARIIKFKQVS